MVTALTAAVLTPTAAHAEQAVPQAGSWTQLRQTVPPLGDTPDLQQTDGNAVPVENSPLGALAFGAVRLDAGQVPTRLTLSVLSGGTPSVPAVWACPTTTGWSTGPRQPWAKRPSYSCDRHVVGVVQGTTVTWALADLLAGGTFLDVVLVPDPADTTPYALSFAAPAAGSVQLASGPPPPEPEPRGTVPELVALPVAPAAAPFPVAGGVVPVPTGAPAPVPTPAVAAAAPQAAPAVLAGGSGVPDRAWAGRALLALLALLVMLRAALPSRALAPARSLLARPLEEVR